jgi:redox-sensitive bicupin YhaK (pirin superfamily)
MRGFQLWLNLPARDKMTAPRYQDIPPESIPEVEFGDGVTVRVVAGRLGATEGPVKAVATEPAYFDVRLAPGSEFAAPLPAGHTAFAYVYEGGVRIGERAVTRGELAILGAGDHARLAGGASGGRAVLVAGRPLREPIAKYGPFVMNTAAEIRQAVEDFNAGRF